MKLYFENGKKIKLEKLNQIILKDTQEFSDIIVLCLGPYKQATSPFLTFATKVGTILKTNHFPVYGDAENPILIAKEEINPILEKIKVEHPNAFILVVMASISDTRKTLGNIYYTKSPFEREDFKIGNAIIQLCGSYGTMNSSYDEKIEKYAENSLSLTTINETAMDIALTLMKVRNQKQDLNDIKKEIQRTLTVKKET